MDPYNGPSSPYFQMPFPFSYTTKYSAHLLFYRNHCTIRTDLKRLFQYWRSEWILWLPSSCRGSEEEGTKKKIKWNRFIILRSLFSRCAVTKPFDHDTYIFKKNKKKCIAQSMLHHKQTISYCYLFQGGFKYPQFFCVSFLFFKILVI